MSETILDVMHETAEGLHKAGAMDVKTMRQIEALCLSPVKEYSANQIKKLRLKNKASQRVFAAYFNISPSTIQKWETGQKRPNGASLKLLNMVDQRGLEVLT
jgi:putative transcriptional regulator